jgi:hypothetical protein
LERALAVVVVCTSAVALAAPSLGERGKKIRAMDNAPPPEALKRKERSEVILRAEAVPINKSLPVIEIESKVTRRSKEEVAFRAMSLLAMAMKAEGMDQETAEKVVEQYGLAPHLTPKEQAFLRDLSPSEEDRAQFVWRYEAAWTLLWALGYVDAMKKPTAVCDLARAVTIMKKRTARQFITDAKLRPLKEILDQADRIYRYDWAVEDARVKTTKTPSGLNADVTQERHYALNWLIGYMNQEWDEVSTDT